MTDKCSNCGKTSKKGFYKACSDKCRIINTKRVIGYWSKVMSKLPKVGILERYITK